MSGCSFSSVVPITRCAMRFAMPTSSLSSSSSGTAFLPSRAWRAAPPSSRTSVGSRMSSGEHPAIAESPIVDATPETLTDRLRELVLDPERREKLGARGREYVLRWHSDAAAAEMWHSIVDAVWRGMPVPRHSTPLASRAGAERSDRRRVTGPCSRRAAWLVRLSGDGSAHTRKADARLRVQRRRPADRGARDSPDHRARADDVRVRRPRDRDRVRRPRQDPGGSRSVVREPAELLRLHGRASGRAPKLARDDLRRDDDPCRACSQC